MSTIKGFVIEGSEKNHYLHRTGKWVKYDNPAKAYVWTKDEVQAILKDFGKIRKGITPENVLPATFTTPRGGITTTTGGAIPASKFTGSRISVSGATIRPGSNFDTAFNVIAADMSL